MLIPYDIKDVYTKYGPHRRPEGCCHMATFQWYHRNGILHTRVDIHGEQIRRMTYQELHNDSLGVWHEKMCQEQQEVDLYRSVVHLLTEVV